MSTLKNESPVSRVIPRQVTQIQNFSQIMSWIFLKKFMLKPLLNYGTLRHHTGVLKYFLKLLKFFFFFLSELSFRLIVCMCTQSLINYFCFTGLGLKFGLTIQENHNMHSFKQRLLNGYNGQSDNRNVRTKNLSISKTHLSTSVSTNLCFCVVLM